MGKHHRKAMAVWMDKSLPCSNPFPAKSSKKLQWKHPLYCCFANLCIEEQRRTRPPYHRCLNGKYQGQIHMIHELESEAKLARNQHALKTSSETWFIPTCITKSDTRQTEIVTVKFKGPYLSSARIPYRSLRFEQVVRLCHYDIVDTQGNNSIYSVVFQ